MCGQAWVLDLHGFAGKEVGGAEEVNKPGPAGGFHSTWEAAGERAAGEDGNPRKQGAQVQAPEGSRSKCLSNTRSLGIRPREAAHWVWDLP